MKILLFTICIASYASSTKDNKYDMAHSKQGEVATAQISDQNGNSMGTIKITQDHKGIKITGQVSGLQPKGIHGFHIHSVGECKGDFKSAAGHFDPFKINHHGALSHSSHAGDLGNILADESGIAKVNKYKTELDITGKNYKLRGKSIIIHKGMDDTESQPSGASGPRIACGIIK